MTSFLPPTDRMFVLLSEKRAALEGLAKNYDDGGLWAGKELANQIAMLVYKEGRGTSLLTHLGVQSKLAYVSSIEGHPLRHARGEVMPPSPMLAFQATDSGWRVVANRQLLIPEEWIAYRKFNKWWNEPVCNWRGGSLSRKNLVMAARDQDGGAHIDAEVTDKGYVSLAHDLDIRVRMDGQALPNGHVACIRQIAWEVAETLRRAFG